MDLFSSGESRWLGVQTDFAAGIRISRSGNEFRGWHPDSALGKRISWPASGFRARETNFAAGNAVLVAGGQVTADSAKDACAFEGAETAGDLLLYFGHPDIVFALIVCERHTRIGQETQCFDFKVA